MRQQLYNQRLQSREWNRVSDTPHTGDANNLLPICGADVRRILDELLRSAFALRFRRPPRASCLPEPPWPVCVYSVAGTGALARISSVDTNAGRPGRGRLRDAAALCHVGHARTHVHAPCRAPLFESLRLLFSARLIRARHGELLIYWDVPLDLAALEPPTRCRLKDINMWRLH